MKSRLIGATIRGHSDLLADTLTFRTDKGNVTWRVEGDCCSEGQFTDIINNVIGFGPVAEVDEMSMTDEHINPECLSKQPQHQEVEGIYGVLLRDVNGNEVTVVHRNWSNGYYGNFFREEKSK
jgi:hypothetical protein